MIALTLAEIESILAGTMITDDIPRDRIVSGPVQTDSREITPGAIFFALPGKKTDGHHFAARAEAAGAALIIVERKLDLTAPQILVASGVEALGKLAAAVVARVRSAGALTVIGITGSNGKTTTKNMLRAILELEGPTVAPPGSFNNHVGAPVSMLGIESDTRFLIVEMGASGAGEIARLVAMAKPDIGVVLKVGLAHAGEFGGIEATQRAKAEMVTDLTAEAVAVLNADDARVVQMAEATKARVRWFGLSAGAGIRGESIEATAAGTSFTVVADRDRRQVRLRMLGEHQVMNALAAVAIAVELGVPLGRAVAALEAMPRAERWRMEVLTSSCGATVINDAYNASPDSMAAALKTLAQIAIDGRRSIAVLGEMAELGEFADEEHDRIGRLAVRLNIRKLVVVGSAARHIHQAAALEGSWDGESILVDSPEQAYDLLRDQLRPDDVVLVKSSKSAELRFLGDRLGQVTG